ncbi:hypothetical protein IQ254_25935 [Nodosilinea sp. LEGE 07088]|uniref:hypothetical protein n=1 Tax=Nodosilinea sp. LEGE 07088 TaxID=2777968 RepID=UPI00188122E6|nr:hypothetical protein [Nodosilinea sp. LEGE 07088]MBE9140600.1 hypothetical protein [Nodosilinea sp. LEGE 07088]
MAEIDRTVFVRVVTLDPVVGTPIPVPDARVTVQHRRTAWFDQTLSQGNPVTDSDGIAEVVLRFEEEDEAGLNPYFTLALPEGLRQVSGDTLDPLRPSFTLPGDWESRHDNASRIRNLTTDFGDRASPFTVYMGLGAQLQLSYSDFRAAHSNPIALPENAVEVVVIDEDIFFDDTLKGVGYHPRENRIIPFGKTEADDRNDDRYPYFDIAPTVPYALDLSAAEAAQPRAWIDPPGAPLGLLGGGSFEQVGLLATDAHGFVFMVDSAPANPVIHRFYPDGTLCETIATWGEDDSPFTTIHGLALDQEQRLYVIDDTQVLIFSLDSGQVELTSQGQLPVSVGRYGLVGRLQRWDDIDPLEGQKEFGRPSGIAVVSGEARFSGSELLVVSDVGVETPTLFESGPALHVFTTGDAPRSQGSLTGATVQAPHSLSSSFDGSLLVCDRSRHSLTRWLPGTEILGPAFISDWDVIGTAGGGSGPFATPQVVAMDRKNEVVYVIDGSNPQLQRLNFTDGTPLPAWSTPYAESPTNPFSPVALAIDERGEIYVADGGNNRLVRSSTFAANGDALAITSLPRPVQIWTPHSELPHLHQPAYVHLDQQGQLWVSDTGNNRVLLYQSDPAVDEERWQLVRTITGISAPAGITTAPTGEAFVVESGTNSIRQLSVAGDTTATTTPADALNQPRGIAYGVRPEGPAVYVADTGNNRVLRISLDGSSESLSPDGAGGGLKAPEDLAIDREGLLYVVDTGNNRLVRFDSADGFDRIFPLDDFSPGFEAPAGLSITAADQLLVTDRQRQFVALFSLWPVADASALRLTSTWDLQRFLPQSLYQLHGAELDGTVHFGSGLAVRQIDDYRDLPTWEVITAGVITVVQVGNDTTETSISEPISLALGDLVFKTNNQPVNQRDQLAITRDDTIYQADLARHLLFSRPTRAVLSDAGILAVADPGNHRVRLLRTCTTLQGNLFDLGLGLFEGYPDLYLRGRSRYDLSQDPKTGLKLAAGRNTSRFGNADQYKTSTLDEYSADTYLTTARITDQTSLKAMTVNALRLMREVQRWLVHITRRDTADQRWGNPDKPQFLGADIISDALGSFHRWFSDVVSLGADRSGRGHDAWDDSTVAHEVGHWIFDASLRRRHLCELRRGYRIKEHFSSYLYSQTVAIIEGFAEYIQLFWGSEFGPHQRLRGFSRQELNSLRRTDSDSILNLYGEPNLGLLSEGYFANTLWQIHQVIANPGLRFADSPCYWWTYNCHLTTDQSQRLVDLLRVPLRQFPDNAPNWADAPTEHLFQQILVQAHNQHPEYVSLIQQIYELNNQLGFQLRLRRLEGSNPGPVVVSPLALAAEAEVALVADLRDSTGAAVVGHNLGFGVKGEGSLTMLTPAATPNRGSPASDLFDSSQIDGDPEQRPTDAQGEVRFIYRAPASAAENSQLQIAYRPRFVSDFPRREDSREVTLQKLYLQALNYAGPPENEHGNLARMGFQLSLTVEVQLS